MAKLKLLTIGFLLLSFFVSKFIYAQDTSIPGLPKIGNSIDNISFKEVQYYTRKQVSMNDFKGKFLILDFFTTGCSSCFKSLPRINQLAIDFKDRVQILMVGLDERNLREIYAEYRKKHNLQLPVAFIGRSQWENFEIFGVPHVIIISPAGKVMAITTSFDSKDIETLLMGEDPKLLVKPSEKEFDKMQTTYDWQQPLLTNGNGGTDSVIISRSMLTYWSGYIRSLTNPDFMVDINASGDYTGDKKIARFEVVGYNLKQLYHIAFGDTVETYPSIYRKNSYGKFWKEPILEVRDSSVFSFKTNSSKNLFNYSVMVPKTKNSTAIMQSILQRDLDAIFCYKGFVEERMMPCWRLVSTTSAGKELVAKGSKFSGKPSVRTDIMLLDQPVSKLIEELYLSFPKGYPIFDETGITTNIDVYIEGLREDFDDMRRGLRKNGLDLIKSEKKMKVVVIRDSKPETSSK